MRQKIRSGQAIKPASDAPTTNTPWISRPARQLDSAHLVERLAEDGVIKDHAKAARLSGTSRDRITRSVNL